MGRSRKDPYSPHRGISAVRRGRGEKLFLIIVNVLVHPKGVGGLTSYFLRGGGMDVFWNDPMTFRQKFFLQDWPQGAHPGSY